MLLITPVGQQFEYHNTEEGVCLAKENLNSVEKLPAHRPSAR
jgi:hypothetical protein